MSPEQLQQFFEDRLEREDEIATQRGEMKEALESFCSSTKADKKAVTMAYRLFKLLQKDRHNAEVVQFEYDKLADMLIKKGE